MSAVPNHYRGVWVRKLLETPQQRDETSFVRWMQTSVWHADLRIPASARRDGMPSGGNQRTPLQLQILANQQGFCGETEVTAQAQGEVCTWHRRSDFQPPRKDTDAGVMVFEKPDRVIETGMHAPYLEIWDRLPDSTGRYIVLSALDSAGRATQERVLLAGCYLMHIRPRQQPWPDGTKTGQSLASLVQQHPAIAQQLLDFEISFGKLNAGCWTIERSTLPELEARRVPFGLKRAQQSVAIVEGCVSSATWQIDEWTCTESSI